MEHFVRLCQNLYAVRKANKKSQTQIANILGVTFQQIQKYEHGDNLINLMRLMMFCDHFKISVGRFFEMDAYGIIESSDLPLHLKEKDFQYLQGMENYIKQKGKKYGQDDKSRSDENMVRESFGQGTHL